MSAAAMPYSNIIQSLIGGLTPQQTPSFGRGPVAGAFSQAQNQANRANASRGQDILRLLSQQGQSQMDQNRVDFKDQLGAIDQSAMNRGITNTTVVDNLKQGAQDHLAANNQAVSERAASNLAGMANSFTQQGPNLGLMAQLLQQGGGGGGGISGTIVNGPRPFEFAPVGNLKDLPWG